MGGWAGEGTGVVQCLLLSCGMVVMECGCIRYSIPTIGDLFHYVGLGRGR